MKHAREITWVLHAKTLGTEHVLLSPSRPWDLGEQSWSLPALPLQSKTKGVPIASLQRILKTRQAGTRTISKAISVFIGLKELTAKPWEIWWACRKHQWRSWRLYPWFEQKWRVQASLSLWLVGMGFHAWSNPRLVRPKNNPVLVGEAGGRKNRSCLRSGQRVAAMFSWNRTNACLRIGSHECRCSDASIRDFERRMNNIRTSKKTVVILFIDELHTIMGSGSGIDSTLDAANILKPSFFWGTLRTVGATTPRKVPSISRKNPLSTFLQKVTIEEPSVVNGIQILKAWKERPRFTIMWPVPMKRSKQRQICPPLTDQPSIPDSQLLISWLKAATVKPRFQRSRKELTALGRARWTASGRKQPQLLEVRPLPLSARSHDQDVLVTLDQLSNYSNSRNWKPKPCQKYLNLEAELLARDWSGRRSRFSISRAIRRNQLRGSMATSVRSVLSCSRTYRCGKKTS